MNLFVHICHVCLWMYICIFIFFSILIHRQTHYKEKIIPPMVEHKDIWFHWVIVTQFATVYCCAAQTNYSLFGISLPVVHIFVSALPIFYGHYVSSRPSVTKGHPPIFPHTCSVAAKWRQEKESWWGFSLVWWCSKEVNRVPVRNSAHNLWTWDWQWAKYKF